MTPTHDAEQPTQAEWLAWLSQGAVDEKRGGSLWFVIRTKQGAPSLREKMRSVFGNAEVVALRGGFRVLRSNLSATLK